MNKNLVGTMLVADAAKELGVKQFIFASSGAVYADSPKRLAETFDVAPIDIYGLSKFAAEEALRLASHSSSLQIVVARLFNNYGPRETNDHIIPEIINQLRKGRKLRLGNIDTKRDFISTKECSRVLIELSNVTLPAWEIFNVGTGSESSIRDLINLIAEIQGETIEIELDKSRYRKADKESQIADVSKLRQCLGWSPSLSFKSGLRDLLEFEGLKTQA
jgi:nucleoside-diphosphate-sugar epimerase